MKTYIFRSPVTAMSKLKVCSSLDGDRWEHVSVHGTDQHGNDYIPCWEEMCFIKEQFWDDEHTVIQFHPKKSSYVNMHKHVLHLWRDLKHPFELPS